VTPGFAWALRAIRGPGTGRVRALGGLINESIEAAEIATTFVTANLRRLRYWLPGRAADRPKMLFKRTEDLFILTSDPECAKAGASGTAAMAVVIMMLLDIELCGKVGISGTMDLFGRVGPVAALEQKTGAAMQQEVRGKERTAGWARNRAVSLRQLDLLVVPASNLAELKQQDFDLCSVHRCRGARLCPPRNARRTHHCGRHGARGPRCVPQPEGVTWCP
jgi:hypothetical protein